MGKVPHKLNYVCTNLSCKWPNEHTFIKFSRNKKMKSKSEHQKPNSNQQQNDREKEQGHVHQQQKGETSEAKDSPRKKNQANYIEVKEDVVKEEKLF